MSEKPIIFFDGVCGLCNRAVDFLIRRDKNRLFRFAPLQGKTASIVLPSALLDQPETIVCKNGDVLYYKSNAILHILIQIGGGWKLAVLLYVIPKFIRDLCYDMVAHNRYKVFGKKESCRLPSPEEREVFLD